MRVCIKLFANFRKDRFNETFREYPAGTECQYVIHDLGLGDGQVGILLVNHQHAAPSQVLRDGDTLSLFPLIGGG